MESSGTTTLDIEQIDAGLNEVAGHLNPQHACLTDLTVALLANESTWAGPGVYRAEQYLAWKTGLSLTRAKQIVTIARRVAELPVSIDAFRHGELAVDQIYAIALRAPWWADREVCWPATPPCTSCATRSVATRSRRSPTRTHTGTATATRTGDATRTATSAHTQR